ncbi:MAG: hypothetical protein Q8O41_10675 [Candidatus Methanoperedens sp.]|nr:hypothetical protein [Candidatus Methanoperedens sp.]
MNTITIPKSEYSKIVRTQEALKKRVDLLQKMFKEEICEEVRPEYIKKLERIDKEIDKGKCTRFSSAAEMKKYLRNL